MSNSYGVFAREQIILIDGYKMLRIELEAQRAWALEWNGVHSWITSLFQWCSKRQINPPNSLWKKYNLRLVMETHTRQQTETLTADIDTVWETSIFVHQATMLFYLPIFLPLLNCTFYSDLRYHWKHIGDTMSRCPVRSTSQGESLLKRPREPT